MELSDGTVIPSYLTPTWGQVVKSQQFDNTALRVGEVEEIIYSTSKQSMAKTAVEYRVAVMTRDSGGAVATVSYPNCRIANLFGGGADTFRYTLRARVVDPQTHKVTSNGSKVLILCINGQSQQAFIVGGIPDSPPVAKEDAGHNLFAEFNGTSCTIDSKGALQFQFRGATDAANKLLESAKEENSDSFLRLLSDGGIKAETPKAAQYLFLNHADKKLEFQADEAWNVHANKKISIDAGDAIDIQGKSSGNLQVSGGLTLKSSGVRIGAATDATMMGTTYRAAQQTMHSTMSGILNGIVTSLTAVAGGLSATAPAAAAALTSTTIPLVVSLGNAITSFESQSARFLSQKNLSD